MGLSPGLWTNIWDMGEMLQCKNKFKNKLHGLQNVNGRERGNENEKNYRKRMGGIDIDRGLAFCLRFF